MLNYYLGKLDRLAQRAVNLQLVMGFHRRADSTEPSIWTQDPSSMWIIMETWVCEDIWEMLAYLLCIQVAPVNQIYFVVRSTI